MTRTLVGITSDEPIEAVAHRVASSLGVPFHARESDHYGDPYYSSPPPAYSLMLTENTDPQFRPDDPPEERFFVPHAPDCRYILWCDDEWRAKLLEVVDLLRSGGLSARPVDHD